MRMRFGWPSTGVHSRRSRSMAANSSDSDGTIDDGRFYATIVDVVVSPGYQRKGVGRAIVEDGNSEWLTGFLVVTLTAAHDVQAFYKKLGWRNLTTGMMRPRSKEQARLELLGGSRMTLPLARRRPTWNCSGRSPRSLRSLGARR